MLTVSLSSVAQDAVQQPQQKLNSSSAATLGGDGKGNF
jgi:hypothetical protein